MNAGNLRSRYAAVLLLGFVLVGLGGWGTCYFGLKSAKEKETAGTALKEQPSSQEQPDEALLKSAKPPEPTPVQPVKIALPPLITADETKTAATPSSTPAKPQAARSLSDKQHQEILDTLRKHTGKSITICSAESDPEGLAFAGTLKRVFEEAGWHVEGVKQIPAAKSSAGLSLATGSFPSPESMTAACTAFISAGFTVSQQLDAKLTGGQAELIVGPAQ